MKTVKKYTCDSKIKQKDNFGNVRLIDGVLNFKTFVL